MSDDNFIALSAAYVEGDLDPISRSHLAELVEQQPEQSTVLAEQVRTHLLLHALLNRNAANETVRRARMISGGFTISRSRSVVESARALRSSRSTPRRRYAWWLSATGVGIAAAMTLVLLLPFHHAFPQVSADAGVRIVRAGYDATTNGPLRLNDIIITGAGQRAELTYLAESTRIAMDPYTQIQVVAGAGKRFRLDHGTVAVRAAPQSLEKPLILHTTQAQATVIGTAFNLNAGAFTTWLTVEHGSVRLGLHDGAEIVVTAGQRALAADRLTLIPRDRGCGLIGAYFRTKNLTDQALVRLDSMIDFNWGSNEPAPGIAHPFSIRWTGFIEARFAETYRFYLPSDDGARLWIDDQSVFDHWNVQGFNPDDKRFGVFTFSEDRLRVPIRIEYFEQQTLAAVQLSWESPNQAREVIPASALHPVSP